MGRIDSGSRLIHAPAHAIYSAFLNPTALAAWRPPNGMRAEVRSFEPRAGGRYRMAFIYEGAGRGKTTAKADVFEGRFVELVPDRRIVEQVTFETADPAFAGRMTLTTTLEPSGGATLVSVMAEDVPRGITPEDHAVGIASSLANLARFVGG